MSDIKTRVKGQVNFVRYQDGNLIYRCDDGFEFPVPTSDCGSARFPAQDKAMMFMRWIRNHMSYMNLACSAKPSVGDHLNADALDKAIKEETND